MKWKAFFIIFEGLSSKQIKINFFGTWESDFKGLKNICKWLPLNVLPLLIQETRGKSEENANSATRRIRIILILQKKALFWYFVQERELNEARTQALRYLNNQVHRATASTWLGWFFLGIADTVSVPFLFLLGGDNFQSQILKRGNTGDSKSSCHRYLPGGLTMFLVN